MTTAAGIWNKMRNHVMRGRKDMPKSGRHTTSSFFAPEAKHAYLASSLAVNTQTSLAKSGVCALDTLRCTLTDCLLLRSGTVIRRRLFVDSVVKKSRATQNVKKWSEGTVGGACRSAIQAGLKGAKSRGR